MKIILITILCTALCRAEKGENLEKVRHRRANPRIYEKVYNQNEGLMAVHSACKCEEVQCMAIKGKPLSESEACICFYDNRQADSRPRPPWPCYKQEHWVERKCSACRAFGNCDYSNNPKALYDCYCVKKIKMCVRINIAEGNDTDVSERLVKYWEMQPSTTMSSVREKKIDREKAHGYTVVRKMMSHGILPRQCDRKNQQMVYHSIEQSKIYKGVYKSPRKSCSTEVRTKI